VGEHPTVARTPEGNLVFRRILVPIDFSDCSLLALDYATALGHQFESKVILLHVVEPAVHQDNYFGVTSPMDDNNQSLVEAGRARLAALAQKHSERGGQTESLVRVGRAHSEITDTARAMAADLIVVGTHGSNSREQLLIGSTAERLVRQAPCPVLTVRFAGAEKSRQTQS
jgi:nucleotide-binding universal stress UspA family protein